MGAVRSGGYDVGRVLPIYDRVAQLKHKMLPSHRINKNKLYYQRNTSSQHKHRLMENPARFGVDRRGVDVRVRDPTLEMVMRFPFWAVTDGS